ncbi:MAG TPA: cytochrome c3 family protein, partial [Thermoanaerobaculia bacterium]|nr:cytochrome c3 family protein [Thermoanaerobaculia bacterium]
MGKKQRPGKGSYGDARLPVAGAYPPRQRRRRLMAAGGVLCLGVALWLGASFLVGGGRAVAPGPVASGHANFEADCASCHQGFRAAAEEGCVACHGRLGAGPEDYAFAAHYAYRGAAEPDEARAADVAQREATCAACHREHRGREAALTAVPDALCTGCHPYGSFSRGHPEFEFARASIPDDPNLQVTHRLHVAEVTKRLGLAEPLEACLRCHEPDARGAGFQPLDFDRHCDACHLTADDGTPRLPAGDPADPEAPGLL